jgi:lipopolysaccharide export system protein LptA
MRITIARLRLWIVGIAVLLVAVLAFFFLYARHKARGAIDDLPAKLGADLERSSNGFTYSQSVKGRTAFTIHAASADQYKGGARATLHDVVITLYGAQGDRNDRIAGSEFDYDQKSGVVTAKGEVQIDLQSATPPVVAQNQKAANQAHEDKADADKPATFSPAEVVHIKTSGLVFNQGTQVVSTPEYVEFNTPKADGHSTGATYDVKEGLLVLNSAVELHSDHDGKPVVVHASHVEFLRPDMRAYLLNPITDYQAEHTTSNQAIVYFRKDGSAETIDAKGHVHLKTDDGQEMTAQAAKIALDLRSQPERVDASGGLNFVSNPVGNNPFPHQRHGNAVEGTLLFSPGGNLSHAQARNAVSLVDVQTGLPDDPHGSATRELRASQVDIDFSQDPNGHAVANKVLAVGVASAVLHTIRTKGASQNTTVKGDQLLANLQEGHALTSLHGTGHTSVLEVAASGATNQTNGDVLQVNFLPLSKEAHTAAAKQKQAGDSSGMDSAQIESVVQDGNVVMVQTPAAVTPGHPAATPTKAWAQHANYTAANQLLKLTGSPRINSGNGSGNETGTTDIAADTIDYHRDTAVAYANGNVKATYLQSKTNAPAKQSSTGAGFGGEGPTHIVSTSAVLDQSHGQATFKAQARLWQGANSVSAPVIELTRNPEILKAYGEPPAANAVYTVIASAPSARQQPTVMRVHSRQLLYSDSDRKATFTGAVTAEDPSGVVHSDEAEVFLVAASARPTNPPSKDAPQNGATSKTASTTAQDRIDRVIATGHVVLQQPGRRGTGEKLVYTAADEKFVLTGTSATPPHLNDRAHGTVSGEALIFNSRDDSVVVSGGQSKAVTDTRTAK